MRRSVRVRSIIVPVLRRGCEKRSSKGQKSVEAADLREKLVAFSVGKPPIAMKVG